MGQYLNHRWRILVGSSHINASHKPLSSRGRVPFEPSLRLDFLHMGAVYDGIVANDSPSFTVVSDLTVVLEAERVSDGGSERPEESIDPTTESCSVRDDISKQGAQESNVYRVPYSFRGCSWIGMNMRTKAVQWERASPHLSSRGMVCLVPIWANKGLSAISLGRLPNRQDSWRQYGTGLPSSVTPAMTS